MGVIDLEVFEVFVLLIAFQFKHYIADYIIQFNTDDHYKKFQKYGWAKPLLNHTFHHGAGSATIAILYLSYCNVCPFSLKFITIVVSIFLFDLILHFIIDRIKASPNFFNRYEYPSKEYFRISGLDQMMHHLTHYAIIFYLIFMSAI
jgi:hypothetical protein